jgi:hypothetical protein
VEELLPIIALGIGALLFAQKSNATTVNPYASIPNGAMTMGSTGMPLMSSNAGLYSTQPYINQSYPNQIYANPAYQQLQAQNGMVNLATGVINKLPDNIGSTIANKVGSVATGQAASAAADSVLSSTASQAASDAAAQAAVENAIAADSAASSIAADAAVTDAASSGILDSIGSTFADWGWAAW